MDSSVPAAQAIRLALISEGVNAWPLYAAQDQGFFADAGLDVETILTRSSVKQLGELIRGGYDIGFQQADHVVRAVEAGSDLFIFMAQAHAPELMLIAEPDVRDFAQLKGRDIAVDGARTGYALLLRKLLAGRGLDDGDYTFREIGGSRERFEALRSGNAAATLLNPPFDRNLLAAGYTRLASTAECFPTYPGSIAAARRGWAERNPEALSAFIRAFDRGYAWLGKPASRSSAEKLLIDRLDIDADAARCAYDAFAQESQPRIAADALAQVIDLVWSAEGWPDPKGAPEKYLDLSYLGIAISD